MMINFDIVAANSTNEKVLNSKQGERIVRIVIVPLSKDAGNVYLKDGGNGTPMLVYAGKGEIGGILNVSSKSIELGIKCSRSGGWRVNTGLDVECWVIGE